MTSHRPPRKPIQHYGGFILAGTCAFVIDAVLLMLLADGFGIPLLIARILSITVAMIISWQTNRRVTFARTDRSSLSEFARFAGVSWVAQGVNYVVFAAVLLHWPTVWPVWAVAIGAVIALFVSYAGFRYGVFTRPPSHTA